jgi:hypothetical protein
VQAPIIKDRTMGIFYQDSTTTATMSIRALQDAWVVFLRGWSWHWFCTFTFREHVDPESADKRFRLFVSMVNRELYGPRWHKKGVGVQ